MITRDRKPDITSFWLGSWNSCTLCYFCNWHYRWKVNLRIFIWIDWGSINCCISCLRSRSSKRFYSNILMRFWIRHHLYIAWLCINFGLKLYKLLVLSLILCVRSFISINVWKIGSQSPSWSLYYPSSSLIISLILRAFPDHWTCPSAMSLNTSLATTMRTQSRRIVNLAVIIFNHNLIFAHV